jgi:hypothetical protein
MSSPAAPRVLGHSPRGSGEQPSAAHVAAGHQIDLARVARSHHGRGSRAVPVGKVSGRRWCCTALELQGNLLGGYPPALRRPCVGLEAFDAGERYGVVDQGARVARGVDPQLCSGA